MESSNSFSLGGDNSLFFYGGNKPYQGLTDAIKTSISGTTITVTPTPNQIMYNKYTILKKCLVFEFFIPFVYKHNIVVGFINKELVVDANTTVSQDSQHVYHTRNFGEKEKYSFKQIVSEEVEKDKIEAKYENNILTVKLYFVTPPVIDIK